MTPAASLARTLAAHDASSSGHAARTTRLALALARALHAPPSAVGALALGAPLHDVGKIHVAASILRKAGALDADELAEIRRHPVVGASLVGRVRSLRHAVGCVLHHHERWDGGGYPHGLRGEQIPLEARILAVADAYDAMTSTRPYRVALTRAEALRELDRCTGSQFDPRVGEAFLALRATPRPRASSASAGSPRR
jgi:HD-GYP domain-containing protein (c-di-GMP phosphodiesterase class II)